MFRNEDELKKYIAQELRKALPQGWVANYRPQRRNLHRHARELGISDMEWKIFEQRNTPDTPYDYVLRVSGDLRTLILLHSNQLVGASPPPYAGILLNGTIIEVEYLEFHSLSILVAEVLKTKPPNIWVGT